MSSSIELNTKQDFTLRSITKFQRVLLIGMVITSFVIIVICTRWGAGLGDDSYFYIKPVEDILAGNAPSFNPAFPPLLPITLTFLGLVKIEPLTAVRFLNAALFSASALVGFHIVYEVGKSFTFAFLSIAAILLSAVLIEVFSSAMSEPLYIFLMLLAIYYSIQYSNSQKSRHLYLSSITTGLAAFSRYAGLALIASIGVYYTYLAWRRVRGNQARITSEFRTIFIFLIIGSAPIVGYFGFNLLRIGRPVAQSNFSWQLVGEFPFKRLMTNILDWFVPDRLFSSFVDQLITATLAVTILVIIAYLIAYRSRASDALSALVNPTPQFFLVLFIISHLALLTFARGYFSGGDSFNSRYISPAQVVIILFFFIVVSELFSKTGTFSKTFIGFVLLGMFSLLSIRSLYTMQFLNRVGLGYASQRWHISETIAYLNHRPDTPVMSTAAIGVYFWTNRLPTNISREVEEVREFLCVTGGFLVEIDSLPFEFYGIDRQEITQGLIIEQDFSEGTIFRIDPQLCE